MQNFFFFRGDAETNFENNNLDNFFPHSARVPQEDRKLPGTSENTDSFTACELESA